MILKGRGGFFLSYFSWLKSEISGGKRRKLKETLEGKSSVAVRFSPEDGRGRGERYIPTEPERSLQAKRREKGIAF